jgi:CheY-like chemotaxis protein
VKILLVEDDRLAAEMTEETLRSHGGHETVRAASPEEALTRLAVWEPNALVLDLFLPGMDGLAFLRQLRAMRGRQGKVRLPVIVTTAAPTPDLLRVLDVRDELGPLWVLRKPFDPRELLELLQEIADEPS